MENRITIEDYTERLIAVSREDSITLKELKGKMDAIYKKAIAFAKKAEAVDRGKLAEIYSGYASLLQENNGDNPLVKKYYKETLTILQKLRDGGNEKYLQEEVEILRQLAIIRQNVDDKESTRLYEVTLAIYRKLAEEDPKEYLKDVATTLNDLAILHCNRSNNKKAEGEWKEALEILNGYSKESNLYIMYQIATIHTNHADLLRHQKRYEESNVESEEALRMFRFLNKKQPDKYLSDVVCYGLINCALLHEKTKQYDEELNELKEGLTILLTLYAKDQRQYYRVLKIEYVRLLKNILDVVTSKEQVDKVCEILDLILKVAEDTLYFSKFELYDFYHTYGYVLHRHKRDKKLAEEKYIKAIEWSKKLEAHNGDKPMVETAMTLNNLALLHRDMKRYEDSMKEFDEALIIFRKLAKDISETHLEDVVNVLGNLANLHKRIGKKKEAEKEVEEIERINNYLKHNE